MIENTICQADQVRRAGVSRAISTDYPRERLRDKLDLLGSTGEAEGVGGSNGTWIDRRGLKGTKGNFERNALPIEPDRIPVQASGFEPTPPELILARVRNFVRAREEAAKLSGG